MRTSETNAESVILPRIYLARHGETAWSLTGQHTGLTDLPLTERGEGSARSLGYRLVGFSFDKVLTSPLQRASRTCRLAGFAAMAEADSDLAEWNYGEFEGLRTAEIQGKRPGWNLFRDGCPGGESAVEVGVRADRVLKRVCAEGGNVLLFSSGHFLRVLAVRWLGLEPSVGRFLMLNTASLSILGYERSRVICEIVERTPGGHPNQRRKARGGRLDTRIVMNVLVIDIGGTHVKVLVSGRENERAFVSGPTLSPKRMVSEIRKLVADWKYDAVSIGYPGPVLRDRPVSEPWNLGTGWVGFDFASAFKRPVKVMNDAAMQALGSYRGGKMLFLGLGTGLGSAFVVNCIVEPMELGHLPYKKATFEDYVGIRGLERYGESKWRRYVTDAVGRLIAAIEPDEVVLGGGNVKRLKNLPSGCRAGDNANAFLGGFRLWDEAA
jgi:polyphosphate glucokinase